MPIRVIARLDVKPPFVVKPVHFEGVKKIDAPHVLSEKYSQEGADEIFYIDIVSSLYRRPIIFDLIRQSAETVQVPFAVGGGIRSVEDASMLFHGGADKIVINTFALQEDPSIIDKLARVFGSQAVVVHIQAKQWEPEYWECYSDCGRIQSGKSVRDWAKEAVNRGAGEILLSSVDTDGRQRGFDIELIDRVVSDVSVPVVAGSGAGSLDDIKALVNRVKPSGIAFGSVLHYGKVSFSDIKRVVNSGSLS